MGEILQFPQRPPAGQYMTSEQIGQIADSLYHKVHDLTQRMAELHEEREVLLSQYNILVAIMRDRENDQPPPDGEFDAKGIYIGYIGEDHR